MTDETAPGDDAGATDRADRRADEGDGASDAETSDTDTDASASDRRLPVTRRSVLAGLGVAGLLGFGTTAASADPQGEVGSSTNPIRRVYTQEINGGVTGGTALTDLTGDGLTVSSEALAADVGTGLEFDSGTARVDPGGIAGTGLTEEGTTALGIAADGVTGTEIDLASIAGDNLSVDATNAELDASTSSVWADDDGDDRLEISGSETGIDVTDVQTDSFNGGVTGNTDVTSLTGDGLTVSSGALTADVGTGLAFDSGTTQLATPFADLSTLFGSPVSAGGTLDLGGNDITDAGTIATSDNRDLTLDPGGGNGLYLENLTDPQEDNVLTINGDGNVGISSNTSGDIGGGSGLWTDSDDDGLLNPSASGDTGIGVTDVQTDNLTDNGSGNVTIGNSLDFDGNDVSLSDSFNFHINPGSWPYVAFTDTNSQSEVRIDWDQNFVSLHNTDFQIRNDGVVMDDTGATHLTINGGGPLGVNQPLDLNGNDVTDAGTIETGDNRNLTLDPGSSNDLVLANQQSNDASILTIDGNGTVGVGSKSISDIGGGGSGLWEEADSDGLLETSGSETGIDVTTVRAANLRDASGNDHLTLIDGGPLEVNQTLNLRNNGIDDLSSINGGGTSITVEDSLEVLNTVLMRSGLDLHGNHVFDAGTIATNDNRNLTLDPGSSNDLVLENQQSNDASLLTIDGSGAVGVGSKSISDIGGGGSGLWADSDDDGLLNPSDDGDNGIGVTNVQTDNLTDNGSGDVTMGNTLDLNGNNVTDTSSNDLTITKATESNSANDTKEIRLDATESETGDKADIVLNPGSNNGAAQVTNGNLDVQSGTVENTAGSLELQTGVGDLSLQPANDVVLRLSDLDLNGNVLTDSTGDLTILGSSGNGVTINTNGGDRTLELGVPTYDDLSASTAGGNVVAGHPDNTVDNSAVGVVIGGGGNGSYQNTAGGNYATVGGGKGNGAGGRNATVAGGEINQATDNSATVGGGYTNTASGAYSTVPGGGKGAAESNYAFVWNDSSQYHDVPPGNQGLSSDTAVNGEPVTGARTFSVSATNGFRFITGSNSVTYIDDAGNFTSAGNVDATGGLVENSGGSLTLTHRGESGDNLTLDAGENAQEIRIDNLPTASDNKDERILAVDTANNNQLVLGSSDDNLSNVTTSSARYKTNIEPLDSEPGAVLELEPRSFEYERNGTEDVGVIAEQVDEHVPEIVAYDDEGRPDGVKYDRIGVYLVPEVEENRDRLDDLDETTADHDATIEDLEAENEALQEENETLQKEVDRLREENAELEARLDRIETELGIDATTDSQGVADD